LTGTEAPAAELGVAPLYRPAPFVPRQTVEWTGLYLGVNAGYGWGQTSTSTTFSGDPQAGSAFALVNTDPILGTTTIPGVFTTPLGRGATELGGTGVVGSGRPSGPLAGGQIGFNWQAGWFVFGAEFDAQWTEQRASFASGCPKVNCFASDAVKLKSLLTGRARFGVAFDWIMPYVTAGAALVSVSDDLTMNVGGVTGVIDLHPDSKLGWTVGAGVDAALTSNWSVRLEYLYVAAQGVVFDNGARIPPALGTGSAITQMDFHDSIVRVGVNYRFGPRGGPGVIERPLLAPAAGGYASAYNFLPSITNYTDSPVFGAKRTPSATMTADAPQRQAPVTAGRAPAAAVVAGEVPQREAPVAAGQGAERVPAATDDAKAATANAPKSAAPAISRFADIEDTDDSIRRTTTAAAITLPTLNKRSKGDDDNRRLKSIMSICSGC
jgi:outer membrane immunogenic protein